MNGTAGRRMRGGTVHVDADGVLHYERRPHVGRALWGPVVLSRWLPGSETILLNGDGFTDTSATNAQTRLRNIVRAQMASDTNRAKHLAVIPYAALTAAGVVLETVEPIHVQADEMEIIWHRVKVPARPDKMKIVEQPNQRQKIREQTIDGARVRYTEHSEMAWRYIEGVRQWVHLRWRPGAMPWTVFVPATETQQAHWEPLQQVVNVHLFRERRIHANNRVIMTGFGNIETGELPTEEGFYWTENIHHLGACLFSAVSADGSRHEFLSAFDENETQPMYFLAQLPDNSNAATYQEALLALAPPLVHKARLEGRQVRRQGDVFAVETKLTDEEVYALARTRVRRDVVLAGRNTELGRSHREGEVRDRIDCPGGCGHRVWAGNGPKAQQALMIYGTGHTASEVVVTKKGATYIRGTMYHDPQLQERGRLREHADVVLPEGWHIALRNTVPRQQVRQDQPAVVAT